jgi:hypothetical protein
MPMDMAVFRSQQNAAMQVSRGRSASERKRKPSSEPEHEPTEFDDI